MSNSLKVLYAALGYEFRRPELLVEALTHPSAMHGRTARSARTPYERLEFLGDRVLGLIVAEMLFFQFPNENEGALARRHAALVRREACAQVAEQVGLGAHLVVSRGEEESGGRANPTMLGDACEAVIGAIYADGGLEPAKAFVRRLWTPLMGQFATPPKDAKTALQEWAQSLGKPLPTYETLGMEGPPHDPIFLVAVHVDGVVSVNGRGASKRAAEQAAAQTMLESVKQ